MSDPLVGWNRANINSGADSKIQSAKARARFLEEKLVILDITMPIL
jgi:hypothetical protein